MIETLELSRDIFIVIVARYLSLAAMRRHLIG